jgi:hypothetical protein
MTTPTEKEINAFLHDQIRFWNAGDREGFEGLYRRYGRNQLSIEYVGHPIGDGWEAFQQLWEGYNGKFTVEIHQILVNGHEGVCHYGNVLVETGVSSPSLEIYDFGDETLSVRYFHQKQQLDG